MSAITTNFARALVAVHARKLRETIQDVIKTTRDEIVQHKLAEVCAECAWCEREFRDADDFFEDSFTGWVRSVALVELQGNFFRSHAIRKICDAVEFSRRYCDEGAIPFPRIRVRSHRNPIVWCSLPCIDVVAVGVYSVSGGLMNSFAVADAASGKLKHKMKG